MKKKNTYLLGILATIIIGCLLYHRFCCDTGCCTKETSIPSDMNSESVFYPFSLNGNGINFTSQNSLDFLKDDFKMILPVKDSIDLGILTLKNAFDKDEQFLKITGFARKDEINNSAYPNLGFARANDVKNYFVSKGISSTRIEINGEIRDDLSIRKDTLFGSVSFEVLDKLVTEKSKDWSVLKEQINANPLILCFKTGQAKIDLSVEDRKKAASIIEYLDHVADSKLDVVGHTDNVGNHETNIRLGLERADFAKNYLIKNGIPSEKINSSSRGSEEPLTDNLTKEGQAKNRRTVVKIN